MAAIMLNSGLDMLRVMSQGLMYASARQEMRRVYRQDILPKLTGQIPAGQGALLCLETVEPVAEGGPASRQVQLGALRLVGIGVHAQRLQADDVASGAQMTGAVAAGMTRVVRYVWLRSHTIGQI